jgi:hypothetical protein
MPPTPEQSATLLEFVATWDAHVAARAKAIKVTSSGDRFALVGPDGDVRLIENNGTVFTVTKVDRLVPLQ